MDSRTAKINQYMLDSNFLDDSTVVHSTNLVAGVRVAVPPTSWKREEKLGAGGFGTVWREVEQGTGQVRAVKVISKLQLNVREVEALIDLQDVGFGLLPCFLLHSLLHSRIDLET